MGRIGFATAFARERIMIRMSSLTNLQHDDDVTLYPTLASLQPDGKAWRVAVSGSVYRQGRLTLGKKLILGILRRAMRASREEFETDLFRERVRGFVSDAAKGKKLAVRIGGEIYPLASRTKRSGLFHEELVLPVERVDTEGTPVPISLVGDDGEDFGPGGHIHFIPRRGVSVISDIDDTIKITDVHERRTMLVNTFLREFLPIDGIGDVFRRWRQLGAAFHYVSSSPWQLYEPLARHFEDVALPSGTFHLRAFRLRDHMLRRIFLGRRPAKGWVIRGLLQRFPLRRFVLVGDSGEYDPEIYGAIARRFPGQVSSILIRRVPGQKIAPLRWQRAFRKLATTQWQLFDSAEEIAEAVAMAGGEV
jgi:hypothetical protein